MIRTVDWEGILQKYGVKTLNIWKRNKTSLSSPEIWKILRPRSLRKSNVKELNDAYTDTYYNRFVSVPYRTVSTLRQFTFHNTISICLDFQICM